MSWVPPDLALQLTNAEAQRLAESLPKDSELRRRLEERMTPSTVIVCKECGDPNIQLEAWVYFNGGAEGGGDPPGGTYCPTCGENDIETVEVDADDVCEPRQGQAHQPEKEDGP